MTAVQSISSKLFPVKRLPVVIFVLASFFSILESCKKIDTTEVGADLIPAVDNITTFDTLFPVITNNELLPDSSRILRSEDHALGLIANDPDFGRTRADIYALFEPETFGSNPFLKFDSTLIFDSVVLALSYKQQYGDSTSKIKVNVYEIDNDGIFYPKPYGYRVDSAEVFVNNTLLGTQMMDFTKLDDSLTDIRRQDTIKTKNQFRIPLDKSLGYRFVAYDTLTAYKSDSMFRERFRGFAIKVDEAGSPNPQALAYFNLADNNSRLLFYYRVKNNNVITDTLVAQFGFFTYNYTNANRVVRTAANGYSTYLNNNNASDDKLYIQSSPGSMATIRIPGLQGLSNRLIHRAELIFDILDNIPEPVFGKPVSLFLDADDTANKRILAIPYDFSYQDKFQQTVGGYAQNNQYVFNISRYVQSIVTRGEKNFTLRLSAPFRTNATQVFLDGTTITPAPPVTLSGLSINPSIAAGRVILSGGTYANPAKRARLRIVYSKI